jgi:hypothetical protein
MKKTNKDLEFIDEILHSFFEETGIEVKRKLNKGSLKQSESRIVSFSFPDKHVEFFMMIKKVITPYQYVSFLELSKQEKNFLVVSQQITPVMKKFMRMQQISYMDKAGNVFIRTDQHYIFIDGRKAVNNNEEKKPSSRAFTKAGLKLLFHLLSNPDLLKYSYRHLAFLAGVSLDTVNKTFEALKNSGYLVLRKKGEFQLVNRTQLIDLWAHHYTLRLRSSLFVRKFRFVNNEQERNWKKLKLASESTVWGGETAADYLLNDIRTEKFIIYTAESTNEILKKYRLVPDDQGTVYVYRQFWQLEKEEQATAPPLLIYADLLAGNDPRLFDAAQKIKNEFLTNRSDQTKT